MKKSSSSESEIDFLELINQYQVLVNKIARFMLGKLPGSVQLDDLVQSGVMGLMEARKNFDARRGVPFEYFASFRIKGAILDDLRRMDWTPRSLNREARHIDQMIDRLEQKHQGIVSDRMVAEALEVPLETYQKLLADLNYRRLLSTDEEADQSEHLYDVTSGKVLENPEVFEERAEDQLYLAGLIDKLPRLEKMVLKFYYSDDLNLKEIGDILSVSESRVSQIHRQAVHSLKRAVADWR